MRPVLMSYTMKPSERGQQLHNSFNYCSSFYFYIYSISLCPARSNNTKIWSARRVGENQSARGSRKYSECHSRCRCCAHQLTPRSSLMKPTKIDTLLTIFPVSPPPIQVLPRQTCGLYSHTIYRHKYPGGMRKLDSIIRGGELFETILHNPVNIYMTHMSNYANDRLALYTFSELLEFVEKNTNLQLKYAATSEGINDAPLKLAQYYFDLYPKEKQPLWTVSKLTWDYNFKLA